MFADYFKTCYVPDTSFSFNTDDFEISDFSHIFNISPAIVNDKLIKMKGKLCVGPDGISAHFIKFCSSHMSLSLSIIFNKSLNDKTFPDMWKTSFVALILKGGDRSSVSNYRPISILNAIFKIFESIILDFIKP